ncbi:MAG: TM1812 family CRISPR-associated protein, partial [Anaerolineales bacterium]|nr:TM1812 family CRISPR-associated protein [Anaerolineales bacterium]
AYLKAAKRVTIEAVYYGALDMQRDGVAPVIDLSKFVQMLDWLTATEQFIQTGNARQLVGLLQEAEQHKDKRLTPVAKTLERVSQAAFLCQPFTLMEAIEDLGPTLDKAEETLSQVAPPFHLLSKEITGEFDSFKADFPAEHRRVLRAEYRLIRWYIEKNQLIQAMSLAREFIIDGIQYKFTGKLDRGSFARGPRSEFEKAVSGLPKVGGPSPQGTGKFAEDHLNDYGRKIYLNDNGNWNERDLIIKAWGDLEGIRNGLDHAEHQKEPIPLNTLQKKAHKDVLPVLEKLAQAWGLSSDDE